MPQDSFTTTGSQISPMVWVIICALAIFEIASIWRVFTKAGQPGWAAIIPIYNGIVMLQIAGKPIWWILLYLIPLVNIVISVIVTHNLSKNFGHGVGFTLGLIFLSGIFFPILAWGDSEYLGPTAGTPVPA
ncbi:MAG TPA: DUF5684 domain-containing protein [Gemmatimonadales bacterium]|nr:DUF5684 domain-containing protein [Gemmatimonadales bacterium]